MLPPPARGVSADHSRRHLDLAADAPRNTPVPACAAHPVRGCRGVFHDVGDAHRGRALDDVGSCNAVRRRGDSADERLIIAILVGTIPAVIFGLFAGEFLDTSVRTPLVVAVAVLAGAALLWVADRAQSLQRPLTGIAALDGVVIGLAQALALIPGISRSGATISAGLLLGFSRDAAARISFLMGIPAIAGAGALELRSLLQEGGDIQQAAPLLLVGLIASFFSGLVAIRLLIRLLSGGKLWSFALYRVGFALLLVAVALLRGEI